MMKTACFELEPWEKDYLKKNVKNVSWQFFDRPLKESDCNEISSVEILVVFVNSQVKENMLSKLRKLKFVVTMSTGFDHIDVAACKKRKIVVSNVPSYGENTVAEQAMALLLAISRKIIPSIEHTRTGDFSTNANLRGFDLKGKTIGIIGTGRIGKHMLRMAHGFEMNVIAFDVCPDNKCAIEHGFVYKSLSQIFNESDIISFHVPYMKQTHHLLNVKNVNQLKSGVIIINTARGAIIQTEALVKGLASGIIGGCGLDVLEGEHELLDERQLLQKNFQKKHDLKTLLEDHILMDHPRVIVTPHNAFNTTEALTRILDTTVQNIDAVTKGKPINVVILK